VHVAVHVATMDPITALGAANSIVQFVDFATRVVCKGNKIYRSGNGMLQEHEDLSFVTSDLIVMKDNFERLNSDVQRPSKDTADGAMQEIYQAAIVLAEQLLRRLTMACAQGRFRCWKSLRQAIKAVSSKQEVDDMASRLAMFRQQLSLRVLISLR
jgi:hypothetical protein